MGRTLSVLILASTLLFALHGYADASEPEAIRRAKAAHPQVWDACDSACISARLASEPFLLQLAQRSGARVEDVARLSVVLAYEWGFQFEKTYKRPPSRDDWESAYSARAERLRYELRASPVLFAVDRWAEERYYRLKLEYGGPY